LDEYSIHKIAMRIEELPCVIHQDYHDESKGDINKQINFVFGTFKVLLLLGIAGHHTFSKFT